jgi:hypothetical protein
MGQISVIRGKKKTFLALEVGEDSDKSRISTPGNNNIIKHGPAMGQISVI